MPGWIRSLVRSHAQAAAAVELYTVPFYTTVMTSIKDQDSEAYKIMHGVLIEEMMHLQLAANLCIALDTIPAFQFPSYELDVPYVRPGIVLNADMGPLNSSTLGAMLAIETPEEVINDNIHKTSPNFPYSSIGEMYDALLSGIVEVGASSFRWSTRNQQARWVDQGYPQIIKNYHDAYEAVEAIKAQGEGGRLVGNLVKPYKMADFPVDTKYQMNNRLPAGSQGVPYTDVYLKEYSHYGRFLKIQKDAEANGNVFPSVYLGVENPHHPANTALEGKFMSMMTNLNAIWGGGAGGLSPDDLWKYALNAMRESAQAATICWKSEVIPNWLDFDF